MTETILMLSVEYYCPLLRRYSYPYDNYTMTKLTKWKLKELLPSAQQDVSQGLCVVLHISLGEGVYFECCPL